MASVAYIGLGSNLGHPRTQLVAASGNYLTAPVGAGEPQPDYVNAVAALRTALAPGAVLRHLRAIERRHGRRQQRGERRNAPRLLDLDLLLFGRRRLSQSRLIVPHPRMHERAFVMVPLLELEAEPNLPGGRTLGSLRLDRWGAWAVRLYGPALSKSPAA